MGGFLHDLTTRWDGRHIVVIGHVATRWGLGHFINGRPLEDLVIEQFSWQDGWEYSFSVQWRTPSPRGLRDATMDGASQSETEGRILGRE